MTKEKVAQIILGFIQEFGPAFIADYFVTYLNGPKKLAVETLTKAAALHAAGKPDEAKSVLEAHPGGFGLADEMIFETDLLATRRLRRLTDAQLLSLFASINGLTATQRKRLRLAHVNETNSQIRRENLIELAKMDVADRLAFWQATGLFEPDLSDELEHIAALGNDWLDRYTRRPPRMFSRRWRRHQVRQRPWTAFAFRLPGRLILLRGWTLFWTIIAVLIALIILGVIGYKIASYDLKTLITVAMILIVLLGCFRGARLPEVN